MSKEAEEHIKNKFPVTAKVFENKKSFGLHDVAIIAESYHQSKTNILIEKIDNILNDFTNKDLLYNDDLRKIGECRNIINDFLNKKND